MAISAGSIPCPPYIQNEEQHRKAITQWMMRVSPFVTATDPGTLVTQASLSAVNAAGTVGFSAVGTIVSTTVQSAIAEVSVVGTNLSATSGASLVGWAQSATAGIRRTVEDKLQDIFNIRDFGAVGDGVTDCTNAISAAAAAMGAAGGTLYIPNSGTYLVDTSFTLPKNITLQGPHWHLGSPGSNVTSDYATVGGQLRINSAAMITLGSNSGMVGVLALRKGMTFPTTGDSLFSGTAIAVGGEDTFLMNCMVMGFNTAFYLNTFNRPKVMNNNFDNFNCVSIANCQDIARVENNHCWPFSSISYYNANPTSATAAQRGGVAFLFQNVGDANKCLNNFSYGWLRGTQLLNVNYMQLIGCCHDGTIPPLASSGGIHIGSACADVQVIACQTVGNASGVIVDLSSGPYNNINITEHNAAYCGIGVNWLRGNGNLKGATIRDCTVGMVVASTTPNLLVQNCTFYGITKRPISISASISTLTLSNNSFGDWAVGSAPVNQSNHILPTMSMSATLSISHNLQSFNIVGPTSLTLSTVLSGWAGRNITLLFNATNTCVTHNSGFVNNGIFLSGAANYSAGVGSSLHIMFNGQQWIETSRQGPAGTNGINATLSTTASSLISFSLSATLTIANSEIRTFNLVGPTGVSVTTVLSGYPGREVTFLCNAAMTPFVHNVGGVTANGIYLANAANFSAGIGSSLTIHFNGSQWIETGRSQN